MSADTLTAEIRRMAARAGNRIVLGTIPSSNPPMNVPTTDPAAMVKWLPPYGFTGTVHAMDARVGGGHRMSFTNFTTGSSHSFGGTYLELVENERLRYDDYLEEYARERYGMQRRDERVFLMDD